MVNPRILVVVAVWWLSIAASIPLGRPIVNALRDRGLLGISVTAGLVLVATGAVVWTAMLVRRGRLGVRQLITAVVATVALLAVAQLLERAEERWHVVQYGILAIFFWGAIKRPGWPRVLVAVLATGALGWVDEGVQYCLPDRVYDLRDVFLNALSGALGVGVAEGVRARRAAKGTKK